MSPLVSNPGSCPAHQASVEHLERIDARIEDLEVEGADRERRLTRLETRLETETSGRARMLAALLPIILATVSAAVSIWTALHKVHP